MNIMAIILILLMAYLSWCDDFSIAYIAQHCHSQLPNIFKFNTLSGRHKGSLLYEMLYFLTNLLRQGYLKKVYYLILIIF